MTSTLQCEYYQCFTFKCNKFKLTCTSHGGMYSAHYFGKILCLRVKAQRYFLKLQLHALSKKTVPKISLNPGLNLTIFLGNWPCWFF